MLLRTALEVLLLKMAPRRCLFGCEEKHRKEMNKVDFSRTAKKIKRRSFLFPIGILNRKLFFVCDLGQIRDWTSHKMPVEVQRLCQRLARREESEAQAVGKKPSFRGSNQKNIQYKVFDHTSFLWVFLVNLYIFLRVVPFSFC